jgi:PAS domain S-box-containing protein
MQPRSPRELLQNCTILGFWSILAVLGGIYLSRQPDNIATLWFANALAIGYCVHQPMRQWPALFATYALSNLAGNLLYGDELLLSLSFIPGNTLEVALGCVLTHRFVNVKYAAQNPNETVKMLLYGAILPGMIGASIGAMTVAWHGFAPFAKVWPAWYIGSLIGAFAVLPLVCHLQTAEPRNLFAHPSRFWLILVASISTLYFAYTKLPYPHTYVMLPLLIAAFLLNHLQVTMLLLGITLAIGSLISFGAYHPTVIHDPWSIFSAYLPIALQLAAPLLLSASLRQREIMLEASHATEIKLRESSQLLDTVIEHIPNMVFLKHAQDLRFALFNKAGETLLGYSRHDLLGKNDYDFFPIEQADFFTSRDRAVLTSHDIDVQEEPIDTASQGQRLLRTQKVAIRNENGEAKYLLGISEDITDRKRVEQELIQSRAAAEKASRAKSEFVANMSHEIRTPMNAVLGATQLLKSTSLSGEQQRLLNMLDTAGRSLMQILNDILDFSKIEAGRLELAPVSFSLHHITKSIATIMAMNAGQKTLELAIGNNTRITHNLIGDELRLHQILVNLVGNAIKFTEHGEVSLLINAEHQENDKIVLRFIVRDTGVGMSPEQQEHIFQAFTQADTSTTRRFGGTGLGLTICKRLVEMMGGSIYFTSTLGRGTEFHLQLPFLMGINHEQPQKLSERTIRFLLVDDNAIARECMRNNILLWGWQVDIATSGKQALELVRQSIAEHAAHYDVLLIDWQMPEQDGLATLAAIRELTAQGKTTPAIIALAANEYECFVQSDTGHLADAVLMKPITSSTLFDIVNEKLLNPMDTLSPRQEPATAAKNTAPLLGIRVLLVEDNSLNQTVASIMLQRTGAHVEIADDGLIAIATLRGTPNQYDIVLMDAHMPNMDGLSATRYLRDTLHYTKPIIAMTAGVTEDERRACQEAGMNGFIAKPIDETLFLETITKHLPKRDIGTTASIEGTSSPDSEENSPIAMFVKLYNYAIDQPANQQAMQSTLTNVANTCMDKITEAETALRERDYETAIARFHTLKGSIGSLGAQDFYRAAAAIEQAAREQQLEQLETQLTQLRQEGERVITSIRAWQAANMA